MMERRIVDGRDRRIQNLLYREFWNDEFQKLQGKRRWSVVQEERIVVYMR